MKANFNGLHRIHNLCTYLFLFSWTILIKRRQNPQTSEEKNREPANEKESKLILTQENDDNFLKTSRKIESLNALNEITSEKIEQAKKQKNHKLANKLYPKYIKQKIKTINLEMLQDSEALSSSPNEFSELYSDHLTFLYFEYATSLAMDGNFDEAQKLITEIATLGVPELTGNIFYQPGTEDWIFQQLRFQIHKQELAKIECNSELYIHQGVLIICIKTALAQYDTDMSKTRLCNLAFGVGGKHFLSINNNKKKYKEAKDWLWEWYTTTSTQTYNKALQIANEKSKQLNSYLLESN